MPDEVVPTPTPTPTPPTPEPENPYKFTIEGEDVELDRPTLEATLSRANKVFNYVNSLVKDGVIDATGKPIKAAAPAAEPTEPTTEDRVAQLTEELNRLKNDHQSGRLLQNINHQLEAAAKSYPVDDPTLKNFVDSLILAHANNDPTLNIPVAYNNIVKSLNKAFERKHTTYLEAKVKKDAEAGDAPGGAQSFALEKPFTTEQLKRGSIGKALKEKLEALSRIG